MDDGDCKMGSEPPMIILEKISELYMNDAEV